MIERNADDYEALDNLKDGDEAFWVLERTGFRYGYDLIDVKVVGRTATRITVETPKQRLQFMRKTYKQYAPMNSASSILAPRTDYWIARRDEQKRGHMIAFIGDPKRIRKLTDEQLTVIYDKLCEYLADITDKKKGKTKEDNGEQSGSKGV